MDSSAEIDLLQAQLKSLESDRRRAIEKRDNAIPSIEAGDDTGFSLSLAVNSIRELDEQISEVRARIVELRQSENEG